MASNSSVARVGVVGLGGMGHTHASNITDLGHEIVAGADVVEEIREEFADSFDVPTYEDHEAMYDAEELDAVVITTPNKFHEPAAVAALEAGLDVLCEKPLAHTLDSAERIADAAADADGFCMVGFHNRFSTAATLFKAYQADGRFGDVSHVQANYVRRRGIPGGGWFTNEELSGGGALIDIGVHTIDFALYLLDFPEIEEVSGVTRQEFGDDDDYADPDGWRSAWNSSSDTFDVDDSVSAFVRCADGTTISLEVSWAAEQEPTNEFVVRGTDAGASFALGGESLDLVETGTQGVDHYLDATLEGSREHTGHKAEDREFVESVVSGEPPEINTVEEGLAVQRVIDAIYRSSEDGEAKRLVETVEEAPTIQ